MTDDEVLELLRVGNEARAAASSAFERAYAGADSEVAKCWAAHMIAVECDSPEEKLRWNHESLRAAEAAAAVADPRAGGLLPTVLGNVGFSTLLLARPSDARGWYERALASLGSSGLDDERRASYASGINHMIETSTQLSSTTNSGGDRQ